MIVLILFGIKQIAAHFGAKRSNVKEWKRAGAPIVVFNSGNGSRYRADDMELYKWLCDEGKRNASTPSSF